MILHILPDSDWPVAELRPASLATEGFIHCSDPGTAHLPANRLFAGRTDLLLLEIDPMKIGCPVRWEPGSPPIPGGPWFPHVYGPIPATAVRATHPFPPNADGTFTLPPSLAHR